MRKIVLYAMMGAGGACACLGAIALAGNLLLWRGLAFGPEPGLAAAVAAAGVLLVLLGALLFPRHRRPHP
jgi:hypothetical protein